MRLKKDRGDGENRQEITHLAHLSSPEKKKFKEKSKWIVESKIVVSSRSLHRVDRSKKG